MKKVFFLSLFFTCSSFIVGYSQSTWFPNGAEWYYESGNEWAAENVSVEHFVVLDKDTIIEGKSCRIIKGRYSNDIVYEENGRVFYYLNGKFRKIYDFSVKEEDVINIEFKTVQLSSHNLDSTVILQCTVDKIVPVILGGVELKEIHTSYNSYSGSNNDWKYPIASGKFIYLEKVGSEFPGILSNEFIPHFSPSLATLPEDYRRLRCYHDSTIDYISGWWLSMNKPCNFNWSSLTDVKDSKSRIFIYPDPSSRDMMLSITGSLILNAKIIVYEATGKVVMEKKVNSPCNLSLSGFTAGVYYIQIFDNNVLITSEKFIML